MESNPSSVDKIKDCQDIFGVMLQAFYLVESIKDATDHREPDEQLIDQISFLVEEYRDKMADLVPMLDNALKQAYDYARKESLVIEAYKLNTLYQSDTVG
jgi:hypothetical protein